MTVVYLQLAVVLLIGMATGAVGGWFIALHSVRGRVDTERMRARDAIIARDAAIEQLREQRIEDRRPHTLRDLVVKRFSPPSGVCECMHRKAVHDPNSHRSRYDPPGPICKGTIGGAPCPCQQFSEVA